MATSSNIGGKRPSVKSNGKTEKQSGKTGGDDSNKICGFHPLRSLRNIFFGYRRRETPSRDEDADTPSKAKSTDDIAEQIHRHQKEEPTAVVHEPVSVTNSTKPIRRLSRTSIPMVKQLSKSADNLVSPAEWIPAPHGIPSAVSSPFGSETSNLNASTDEIDDGAALDSNSVDEFFVDKWSLVRNSRTRAFSSGDAENVDQEMTCDLDSVHQTKALDVSVAKDRISIKPKGKRVTVAMQQKMLRADALPKPSKTYRLQSLTEANEDEDDGKKEEKEVDSVATTQGETLAPPDKPIRREKKHPLVPNVSSRMTINITPEMLAGARKKASDCSNSAQSSTVNHRHKNGPPPPTCPKKRRTTIEPDGRICAQDKKNEESREESAKNDSTSGGSVTRRPLLSLKEDEVAGEEDGEASRPTAPPRVRPKTRPKTMMPSGVPQTTEAEPEWMARAKKNAMVE